jgi:heptosyltransferase-2/heptosyltransferase-3
LARDTAGQPPRILLIRPDHIGDLLFATPALRVLRRACPDAHLAVMVGPWGQAVVENNPNLDEIIVCEFPAFSRKPKTSFLAPYRLAQQWAEQLRSQHSVLHPAFLAGFDMAVVLRFDHWWGALLAHLARIPQRLGYALAECKPFLSQAVPYESQRHEVQQNLTLVDAAARSMGGSLGWSMPSVLHPAFLAGAEDSLSLEFPIREQDDEYISLYLARRGVPATAPRVPGTPSRVSGTPSRVSGTPSRVLGGVGGVGGVGRVGGAPRPSAGPAPCIAIHPGAGAPVKQWLPEAWAQVGDALAASCQARIVITGSRDELDLAWSVSARMRSDAIVAAGDTSLAQLGALFRRCRLVVGPDCGPLHLAVAVGTPTVHLYGPVDAYKFGPWGDPQKHVVVTSGRACIPCNRLDYSAHELPAHPCIRDIAPGSVLEAAQRLLAQG